MSDNRTSFKLGAFVRLCQMDTGQRIAAVERKLSAITGYDFYHSLTKAIRAYLKGCGPEQIEEILLSPKNAVEREYNIAAYKSFVERYGKMRSIEGIQRPRTYSIPNCPIDVNCDPLFSTTENGVAWVHAIWATRTPALQTKYGAVACLILKECYRNTSLSNASFAIANLTDGRRIGEKSITNTTSTILRSDAAMIAKLLEDAV